MITRTRFASLYIPLLCFAFGIVIEVPSAYAARTCGKSSTEQERTQCYVEEARTADAGLNDAYTSLAKELDAKARNDLRHTQRKWLERRDAACGLAQVNKSGLQWIDSLRGHK